MALDRMEFSNRYLAETLPLFDEYRSEHFAQSLQVIEKAYESGSTIFVCGNGGSAATGSHIVNDLSKGTSVEGKKRLRVLGLTDNMSLFSAYANDCGYESVFVEQMKSLWMPGDVLLAISCSGNSPNVLRAAEFARKNGGTVIALVGFSGGKLKELGQPSLHFDTQNFGSCEDAQLMFGHISSQYMHEFIKSNGPAQSHS